MRPARVVAVAPGSPAHAAGVLPGDELVSVGDRPLRDVIEYRWATDEPEVGLELARSGEKIRVTLSKGPGESLGIEVDSPVFDAVRTCDNHCEFCFIHQLPRGLRPSLYVKDDDYRLSFLYGNFTTLTRFTEADLERVIDQNLAPLYVSIHTTDHERRSELLRNRRGGMSLRWLRALLDAGVEVHGQIVVCPGVNDGPVLYDTFTGLLEEYPEIGDVAVVPLGVSRFNSEPRMRAHSRVEAVSVLEAVHEAQAVFLELSGRRVVQAADEYYIMAGMPFPPSDSYEGFEMHEDGVGVARAFALEFEGRGEVRAGGAEGFFRWVDGAPAHGYRDDRAPRRPATPGTAAAESVPTAVLTAPYGAAVLRPLVDSLGRDELRVVEVPNEFFGGTVAVSGLMVGRDLAGVLASEPDGHRYLIPDVCLSGGQFLDGTTPADLPRPVEVVGTDGASLRAALEAA